MRNSIIVGAAAALLVVFACQSPDAPDLGNPLDPSDPDYTPPSTAIVTGPDDAATVTDADVTFTWRGSDRVSEYRYRWDEGEWSDWAAGTSATLELLDEGEHAFAVVGRYPTGAEQALPTARTFVVDAVKGPALMFRPRKVVVATGDTFTVDLMAEEVGDLMLAHVVIDFDGDALVLDSVKQGGFLAEAGGSVVFLDDATPGRVLVDAGVAEGDPAGVSGTGVLATLAFRAAVATTSALEIPSGAAFRDPSNGPTPIAETAPGMVVVE